MRSGPLHIPFYIGCVISEVIEAFSEQKKISSSCYQEGKPLWILRKQNKKTIRIVRLMACELSGEKRPPGKYFCFFPELIRLDKPEGKSAKTAPVSKTEIISLDDLSDLFWQDRRDHEQFKKWLEGALENSWRIALKLR